jgi:hypothetical protein
MKYVDHAFNILVYCGALVWLYLMCDVLLAFKRWLQFKSQIHPIDIKFPHSVIVKHVHASDDDEKPEPDNAKKKLAN